MQSGPIPTTSAPAARYVWRNSATPTPARICSWRPVNEPASPATPTPTPAGELRTVRVQREVVLSAGSINSPQLLMLSGIGPADHLRSVGIEPVVDLSWVGSNLSDHLASGIVVGTSRTDTLVAAETIPNLLNYLTRRGLAHFERRRGARLPTQPSRPRGPGHRTDLRAGCVSRPRRHRADGARFHRGCRPVTARVARHHQAGIERPAGATRDRSAYLSAEADVATLAWGVGRAVEVVRTEPLAGVVTHPIRPTPIPETEEGRRDSLRAHAETLYPPAGTCAMGVDESAVVDPELRVRGVEGLPGRRRFRHAQVDQGSHPRCHDHDCRAGCRPLARPLTELAERRRG
jgi:choline dehydrogenase